MHIHDWVIYLQPRFNNKINKTRSQESISITITAVQWDFHLASQTSKTAKVWVGTLMVHVYQPNIITKHGTYLVSYTNKCIFSISFKEMWTRCMSDASKTMIITKESIIQHGTFMYYVYVLKHNIPTSKLAPIHCKDGQMFLAHLRLFSSRPPQPISLSRLADR